MSMTSGFSVRIGWTQLVQGFLSNHMRKHTVTVPHVIHMYSYIFSYFVTLLKQMCFYHIKSQSNSLNDTQL